MIRRLNKPDEKELTDAADKIDQRIRDEIAAGLAARRKLQIPQEPKYTSDNESS